MAYYGYLRVSTETQAEKGGGLETQRQNIEKYCDAHGITMENIFADAGISGAVKATDDDDAIRKRPGLIEMLVTAKDGDTVIVMNTSRLWRTDTAKVFIRRELMKRNIKVTSVEQPNFDLYSPNPSDKLFASLMEAMDEWERDTIVLKLAKGRTAKAKGGDKPAGVCPFGYRYSDDKKSVLVDPDEAQIVKFMFTEGQKGRSLAEITDELNAKGTKTRRGNEWTRGSVRAILRNRFYIGEIVHDSEKAREMPGYTPNYTRGNHEAIVSKIQFGKVGAQLDKRHK